MLYDRIVDNKEVGRKIWKICTAFNNDLYSVERFVLRWKICTTLNDLYYVERFVLRWMICTTLNDLYYVEWYVLRWMICTTLSDLYYVERSELRWMNFITLNDLYYVEWFVQRWMIFYFLAKFVGPRMICTALKDLYYVEWFGVRWMICTTLNHLGYDELLSIGFLMSARCAYSKKYCKIFYTNLWVDFLLTWKYQEIFLALPQELVIKRCFWSL